MKKFPLVLSCDWFSYSCYVPFAFRSLAAANEEKLCQLYRVYKWKAHEFSVCESKEFHPCFMRSVALEWKGVQVCTLFFGDKRSLKSHAGVAKVANSFLYYGDWAGVFMNALRAVGWRNIAVKRVDVCADFEYFINGRLPHQFIHDYLEEPTASRPSFIRKSSNKYVATGVRGVSHNVLQSVRWGTRESPVQVNMYNKTQELADVKCKPWILEKWKANGLHSGIDEHGKMHWIWRVEFSINASQLAIRTKDRSRVLNISLNDVASQAALANLFEILAPNYFQFYYVTLDDVRRKAKVRDLQEVQLFDLGAIPCNLTTMTLARKIGCGRTEKLLLRVLGDVAAAGGVSEDVRDAILKTKSYLAELACEKDRVDAVSSEEVLSAFIYELTTPRTQKLSKMSRAIAAHNAKRFAKLLLCNNSTKFADYSWACDALQSDIDLLRDKILSVLQEAPDEAFECWLEEEIDQEAIAQLNAHSDEIDWDSFDPNKLPPIDCEETKDMHIL